MVQVLSFVIWGIIYTIIIFVIHNIFKFFLITNLNYIEKLKLLLLNNFRLINLIKYIVGGFGLVTGINFLKQIFLFSFESFPITLIIQQSEIIYFIFGGLLMIFCPVYVIFYDDFMLFTKSNLLLKDVLKDKLITFCYEYTRYKEKTKNPELSVISILNAATILVNAPEGTSYFTKNLKFSLQFQLMINDDGIQTPIHSLEIADCIFLKAGGTHAQYKVLKWIENLDYQEQIQELKENKNLKNLKPFIKLSENEIAEKFDYAEMKSYLKTQQTFKSINEEN